MNKSVFIDKLGICLSLCCGIHCLSTTIFVAIGALELFDLAVNEKLEFAMSCGILLIGVAALLPQLIAQRTYGLMALFIGGFILVKTSENMTTLWTQLTLLSLGILAITGAHYFNIKSKRKHAEYIKAVKEAAGYRT
ncbi:MerC domain-containing protein [Fulvivirga sp. M361]|uniref:MerC domain-containing protein n=1 Tax=Fulvivirga sp. M361 TaxID=2594266 RepID=UPI00117A6C23|nr:MerC domain-containing protein [Fulvivirga sp. M361]TRX59183.1 MerC domain-containing protein [Fulvivirga sp. M361]